MTMPADAAAPSALIGTVLKAYCSKCRGDRNCDVAGHRLESGGDGDYEWHRDWYLLACRGCEHIFAQSVGTNSHDFYHDHLPNGDYEIVHSETIASWPARSRRAKPEWFKDSYVFTDIETNALDASLVELYGALDHDLNVLASIGMRTSFDIASEILGVDPNKAFRDKIKDLVDGKLIRDTEKDHIDLLVDAGSASAHRGWKPAASDLDALMDTLEEFIFNNMVVPSRRREAAAKMSKVKAKVPARKTAPSKKKAKDIALPPSSDEAHDEKSSG